MILLAVLYTLIIILIVLFGIQRALLTKSVLQTISVTDTVLPDKTQMPYITIQLPVYNEGHVVKRLIDAVCNLDYPRIKLQIQVLDDSDDETSEQIAKQVGDWQAQGLDITHIQRGTRKEYKAGNLAHGLNQAKGEYIAIFDADFVPQQDWLMKTLIHFYNCDDPERLGLVQTQWGYLNMNDSILTKAQALILDDIAIQQTLRSQNDLFIVFNGSAGLWKRVCIEENGGWSGQTLCEDVELAYRVQLKGWRLQYDNQICSMAEIPTRMLDYKIQQSRWTRGTMQLVRVLIRMLITSPISSRQKLDAITYILSPCIYLLLVILLLCRISLILSPSEYITFLDILMLIGFLGVIAPVLLSWLRHRAVFPWNLLLMAGISLHNTIYLFAGLMRPLGGEFICTPKRGTDHQFNNTVKNHFDKSHFITALELLFVLYIFIGVILSITHNQYFILPVLLVCLVGYIWVAGQSLFEHISSRY